MSALSFMSFGKEWPLVVFAKIFKINSDSFIEEGYKDNRCRLAKPENFTEQTKTKYPLVIYLHGSGKCGNDNSKQICNFSKVTGCPGIYFQSNKNNICLIISRL